MLSTTASLCWASFLNPSSAVNICTEGIAMNIGNTLALINLQTWEKVFYRIDTPALGAGISLLAGHNRFPLIAYAEAIFRPAIHVVKYPDMTKYETFTANNFTSFADIRFSDYDHIVALSGYPDYVLCVWNIRTKQLMVQLSTHIKCLSQSLSCSAASLPAIMQLSKTTDEIHMWQICFRDDNYTLSETTRIKLGETYQLSYVFNSCFAEDGTFYIANDFGTLSSLEVNDYHIKERWTPPDQPYVNPQAHYLCFYKQGFVIYNNRKAYFVRKKSGLWTNEWSLDLSINNIKKFVSNSNDLYAIDYVANIYRVDLVMDTVSLKLMSGENFKAIQYDILKGAKETFVLILDDAHHLRLAHVLTLKLSSKIFIEGSSIMAAHNSLPFVAVATDKFEINFISYERPGAPSIVGTIKSDFCQITSIRLCDSGGLAIDLNNTFYILQVDFWHNSYINRASLETTDDINILNSFLCDENNFLVFVGNYSATKILCASAMWVLRWTHDASEVWRSEFVLPNQYRSVSLGILKGETIEIFAARYHSFIFDIFILSNYGKLELTTSVTTNHFGYLIGISGGKNVITWGVDSTILHFRVHKKSSKPFMISRFLKLELVPKMITDVLECSNLKMPPLSDFPKENLMWSEIRRTIELNRMNVQNLRFSIETVKEFVPTDQQLRIRDQVLRSIKELTVSVRDLINFDISVTGKESGIFKKFCLNGTWLEMFKEQARLLCDIERQSLIKSIEDQQRIRDWMRNLVTGNVLQMATKIRAIFSNAICENYSIAKPQTETYRQMIDYFRLYDIDPIEDEIASPPSQHAEDDELAAEEEEAKIIIGKRYVHASNMYEHVLDPLWAIQDKNELTANQMHNALVKSRSILTDALKQAFNKIFIEVHQVKQEIMDNILVTNNTLAKIHDNMNCMLRLLYMDPYIPDSLTVPIWMNDEILERIMTVDDSEVKAINRHKKKQVETAQKKGRMLLWSVEFWVRALQVMMDGVLEKLWEEEIKKDIPMPEFMNKKQEHEYTLEEQRQARDYLERLRVLGDDRRKYLRILNENERKTLELKNNFIKKINTRCMEMVSWKLKYDFAIKQEQLRLMTLRIFHYKRHLCRNHIQDLRRETDKLNDYIDKFTHLAHFWEKSVANQKSELEMLTTRDKASERSFKASFLNIIPVAFVTEMSKLFKKRPKSTQKSFSSSLVCSEIAEKIGHAKARDIFPLPAECFEYLTALDSLDDIQNMPNQMEPKIWDTFVKLRRQKIESEFKIKAKGYLVLGFQSLANSFVKEVANMKDLRSETLKKLETVVAQYFEIVQNRSLQITLSLGQVEVNYNNSLSVLKNSILMNVSDINGINEMIKLAGKKKLRAMNQAAIFRRQVLFKEWEHKVVKANISYLKYMLGIVNKCKVTMEFLDILRKWKNIKEAKQSSSNVGILERAIEEKIASFRVNLDRVIEHIEKVRQQHDDTKRKNKEINKSIKDLQIDVALSNVKRDCLAEEHMSRDQKGRMKKIKKHAGLIESVRADYVHILELSTILEIQRMRTYPTLPPPPASDCLQD